MRNGQGEETVFIVDEDDAMRESLRAMFEARGFKTLSFDAAAAFKAGHDGISRGCLIIDLIEPGYRALEILHSLAGEMERIPFVVLSDAYSRDLKALAREAGATTCVDKPFEPEYLVSVVRKALSTPA